MSDQPNVIIIAGPNGAGKTTAAPTLLHDLLDIVDFVNADLIAQGLAGFDPHTVDFAAGRVMLSRLRDLAKARRSFAFETTLASRSFAPWIRQLKTHGYAAHLIYVWLRSADLAVSRVAQRVLEGGHNVPEDVIRRRYERSRSNLVSMYLPIMTTWYVYDNSLGAPQLIAERHEPDAPIIHHPVTWQALIERAA